MLRLTKKADYGLIALKFLAERVGTPSVSAKDIADTYGIPQQLLAKVLQRLTKAGILSSHAGTNGGYALSRPADKITAFDIVRVIDGPLFITSCLTAPGRCDLSGVCTVREPLRKVNESISEVLRAIRISDLCESRYPREVHRKPQRQVPLTM